MKFLSASVLVTAFSALATSSPAPGASYWTDVSCGGGRYCLTSETANYLINGFASLLTSFSNATAEKILAPDFTDTSDSINWLAGMPLGSTTFPSKTAFEIGQGSQPPIGFTVLSVDAVTCKHIAFRWAATLGQGLTPIKGINIFYAEVNQGKWQIQSVFSEFNSGLWKQELCQIGAVPASQCSLLSS